MSTAIGCLVSKHVARGLGRGKSRKGDVTLQRKRKLGTKYRTEDIISSSSRRNPSQPTHLGHNRYRPSPLDYLDELHIPVELLPIPDMYGLVHVDG